MWHTVRELIQCLRQECNKHPGLADKPVRIAWERSETEQSDAPILMIGQDKDNFYLCAWSDCPHCKSGTCGTSHKTWHGGMAGPN